MTGSGMQKQESGFEIVRLADVLYEGVFNGKRWEGRHKSRLIKNYMCGNNGDQIMEIT